MEVVDDSEAVLSNYEVLGFLREERKELTGKKKGPSHHPRSGQVATLLLETLSSLESTVASTQTKEAVAEFLTRTEEFGLTRAERLMLLNHRPTTELEVHLLVEESEERLQEEQVSVIYTYVWS